MEHVKVNGVELQYEVVGSGEAMLLIHGAHLADALQPLVTEPALGRFQRIRYHRRGLGGSTSPDDAGPTSVPEQAHDAVRLLDHLGVARAHLAGHSLGGAIALRAGAARTELELRAGAGRGHHLPGAVGARQPTSPLFVQGRQRLHAWFPACRDADIAGATHLLQMQAPTSVATAIAAFL
jgi:alpha-beta hydrolase superfamily lysophospholipase